MIDYKPYILNEEQVKAIKNGDQNAINKFYMDNIELFSRMAKKFLGKVKYFTTSYLDCLHQLFLDIPQLNYETKNKLFLSIRKSFRMVNYGGIKYTCTDKVVWNKNICPLYIKGDKEEICLVDLYKQSGSILDEIENEEELEEQTKKIINIIYKMDIPKLNKKTEIKKIMLVILFGYTQNYVECHYKELCKIHKDIY